MVSQVRRAPHVSTEIAAGGGVVVEHQVTAGCEAEVHHSGHDDRGQSQREDRERKLDDAFVRPRTLRPPSWTPNHASPDADANRHRFNIGVAVSIDRVDVELDHVELDHVDVSIDRVDRFTSNSTMSSAKLSTPSSTRWPEVYHSIRLPGPRSNSGSSRLGSSRRSVMNFPVCQPERDTRCRLSQLIGLFRHRWAHRSPPIDDGKPSRIEGHVRRDSHADATREYHAGPERETRHHQTRPLDRARVNEREQQ